MNHLTIYCRTSIGKKQIVAVTGLFLIGFLVAHLAGNLLVYLGPEAFNGYAKKMAGLRPGLYLAECGLLCVFLVHMSFTALIVWENIQARPARYAAAKSSQKRTLAAMLMPYTGTIILVFVVWHLLDFTFIDHHGPRSILWNGQSYGLYGVVYNSFADPVHSSLYIIAMLAVGFHLSHGTQSFMQTFGFNHPRYTPVIKGISNAFASIITLAFCSIPLYVFIDHMGR